MRSTPAMTRETILPPSAGSIRATTPLARSSTAASDRNEVGTLTTPACSSEERAETQPLETNPNNVSTCGEHNDRWNSPRKHPRYGVADACQRARALFSHAQCERMPVPSPVGG